MRGSRPHQVLLDEAAAFERSQRGPIGSRRRSPQAPHGYVDLRDFWTPDRWERLRKGLHRKGLLQRRPHTPGERKVPKHTALTGPRPKQKSRQEMAYDDYIADSSLRSYEAQLVCAQRKAIGRRHARRKMRRASRQAQRR